jgi:hypothetical protein
MVKEKELSKHYLIREKGKVGASLPKHGTR